MPPRLIIAKGLLGFSLFIGMGCRSQPTDETARISKPEMPMVTTRPAPPEGRVRVAGIILKWVTANRELNYKRAERLIRQAASEGAELVVTTECFLDGYAIRDKTIPIDEWRALGEPIPGGTYLRKLQSLADELNIYLVAGMLERDGLETYNTAVLIDPEGKLTGKYRKQMLGHEVVRNFAGKSSPVFDTPYGRVGLMICADRRYPEVIRRLGENGADLLICPSGGMYGPEQNDFHLQARSRENDAPVIFVHPIEFLITGADGSILDRRFIGDRMDVTEGEVGQESDAHAVAIYDLDLQTSSSRSKTD